MDIENLLGKSEYDLLIQYKKDNLAGEYWNMPHSTECKRIADTPFGKMFFLIAGIYNKTHMAYAVHITIVNILMMN